MKPLHVLLTLLAISAPACTTLNGPAEVSGDIPAQADKVVTSAIILEADGKPINNKLAKLQSGTRTVKIMSLPASGFRGGEVRDVTLELKACTRTFVGVKRENSRTMDWEPLVLRQEPIANCEAK